MAEEQIIRTEEKNEKLDKVKLGEIKNGLLNELVSVGLITEQGFRIQGMGLVLKKLDKIWELIDKTNLKLHYIEKKMENR